MTTVYARYAILDGHEPEQQPIEVEVWEPNPDKPGYLRFVRMKTVQEVYDELKARLEADDLLPDDYFQISSDFRYSDEYRGKKLDEIPLPRHYWRIVSFAVRGSSEGYYVHIGTIFSSGKYQDLFLGKSFQGMEYALKVAAACTRHMEN
jgi:hypothetical protein